ncbi:MAG: hypothetical protein UZ21_OP11001000922 [Microgenomates bacterium OLB22]|nr:MAG: hypothetical protein UZ21_OP11001000922 [Microgenomates bacterium OLB22]
MDILNKKSNSVVLLLFILLTQFAPFYLPERIQVPRTDFSLETGLFSFLKPTTVGTAALTPASVTLSNSRFSYRAGVSSGASGASSVVINGVDTSSISDTTTNHLFPGDTVCFSNAGLSGCQGQTTYSVANIADSTTFNLNTPLTGTLSSSDYVIATQTAIHTIAFTTTNVVPTAGDILITIPASSTDAKTNDGFPDTAATAATNGFDLNSLSTTNVSVSSSGCANNWTVASVTDSNGSTGHLIQINRSTNSCAAGSTITVTVGDGTTKLINPAPTDQHVTQGVAETYSINVKTRDGSDNTIDQSDILVAPVESVFVSATVDETLSFTVAGVTANSGSYCGVTRTSSTPDTTAYSVPWGTISTTYAAATHNTEHQLTVTTNAKSGYYVYALETDQMGMNGNTCTGTAPSAGDYTFSSGTCIRDTVCSASTCSESTLRDWGSDPSSYPGFGYSMEEVSGTDSTFEFDDSSATFNAKQFADEQGSEDETAANVHLMTSSAATSSSSSYVCYRIDVPGDQPAGYYYNTVKYIATPRF